MASLGEILRAEREARGLTASEVGAATHIKVQCIEAIEQNDFSRMAAAAYAKGFIKMYAEFLELDPAPLVLEYVEEHGTGRPAITHDAPPPAASNSARPKRSLPELPGWVSKITPQHVAMFVGGLIIFIFLISAVSRFIRPSSEGPDVDVSAEESSLSAGIIGEPPAPYMDHQE